ncbi:hypothetical protein [uncultured Kordia sp.]|uniref:hypothetical protein n=1 Tax=uncultured Kordia sp. TaxID=507699 RepID=UPI00262B581A|nr:hypothetical protein [uncultured Kordia sp.]
MKEKDITCDPLQLENMPTVQKFSFSEKLIAIILIIIFMTIPLYEISPETFKLNQIVEYVYSCGYLMNY